MNVNELLLTYLKKQYGDEEMVNAFLEKKSLYFPDAFVSDFDVEKQLKFRINAMRYKTSIRTIRQIAETFSRSNVMALFFKGIVLANRLYDKPQKRCVGDVDIFVPREDFSTALTLLIRLGYNFYDQKTFFNEHHIVLIKDDVVLELHKSIFNPILMIDEAYLLKHIEPFFISGHQELAIHTFDLTAIFLHLIYHLYQDTYWSHYSLHSVLVSQKIPTTKRFLHRAYEIALFSERYFGEINWDDIVKDIMRQKPRIFFKKMIYDIIDIFPNVFPKKCLQAVNNMEYIDDEHDVWCKRFIESPCSQGGISYILSSFIEEYWDKRSAHNIHLKAGQGFSLNKPYIKDGEDDNYELTCEVCTEKLNDDLKFTFKISNDDFCFTAEDDFDTSTSDGIHLMLFGTEKYSYNSIYVFPKIINGVARAIPVDVKRSERSVIDPALINTNCTYTDSDYTVTVTLTKEFLQDNSLTNYLYMGLIVVDCSSKAKKRKAELVLSDTYSEWYNPTYFAKIDVSKINRQR